MDLADQTNFDTPAFPVEVAAHAALTPPGSMRMWFQRDRIKLHAMDADYGAPAALPGKRGVPRLLTYRTVLSLAAAAPLVRKGVEVADAYAAAKQWTHWGEGRDPACLFEPPAFTVLVHHSGAEARVVRAAGVAEGMAVGFHELFALGHPVPVAPTLIWLNKAEGYARGVCEGFLK